jgi:hypothetical protein
MNAPTASASLRLSCRPCLGSGTYSFPYEVENVGSADLLVMDATPGMDPESRMASANEQAGVVMLTADDEAVLGKFPAPLPTDRRIAVPVIPLARRLAPGERLRRELRIPAPLAETSPYFPDLPLRRYEIRTVMTVVFAIGYWVAGVDNLVAAPTEHDPALFVVVTRNTLASALRASQRFPTHGLQFFKRMDAFPRTL